jgi:hypothetical protein
MCRIGYERAILNEDRVILTYYCVIHQPNLSTCHSFEGYFFKYY